MSTYNLDALRASYQQMKRDNSFHKGAASFVRELENVPTDYYSNIFFVGRAASKTVVITDVTIDSDNSSFRFNIREVGSEATETVTFDRYKDLAADVARNVIEAIEVAQIVENDAKRAAEETIRRAIAIEQAELRKTL